MTVGVLTYVKAGHEIPAAYQETLLTACKFGFSFSIANKKEGMQSLFYDPAKYDVVKSLAEVSKKFKDKNYCILAYRDEGLGKEELQPFPILVDDEGTELLHMYVEGDLARYQDPKLPVGPETQFVDTYFGGVLLDEYTRAGADLKVMLTNCNAAPFRKSLIEHLEPRCSIFLMTKDDDFLRINRKNTEHAEYAWGETSNALGYKEVVPKVVEEPKEEAVVDDGIPAWRKARMARSGGTEKPAEVVKPVEPAKTDIDEDDDEEDGEVGGDIKSPASGAATGPKIAPAVAAKGLDAKDGTYRDNRIYPPAHLGGRELRRWYKHGIGGHTAFDFKAREGIPVDKLEPGSHLYRLFNGVPEKSPAKQDSGKDTTAHSVDANKALPAQARPQPIMTAEQIEKTKRVVESAFHGSPVTAAQIQAIEGKYPSFSNRLDVKPEEMAVWPQEKWWDVVQTGHKQAWMAILELQAMYLRDHPELLKVAPILEEKKEEEVVDDGVPAWRKARLKGKAA